MFTQIGVSTTWSILQYSSLQLKWDSRHCINITRHVTWVSSIIQRRAFHNSNQIYIIWSTWYWPHYRIISHNGKLAERLINKLEYINNKVPYWKLEGHTGMKLTLLLFLLTYIYSLSTTNMVLLTDIFSPKTQLGFLQIPF